MDVPLSDAFPRLYPKASICLHVLPVEVDRVVTVWFGSHPKRKCPEDMTNFIEMVITSDNLPTNVT